MLQMTLFVVPLSPLAIWAKLGSIVAPRRNDVETGNFEGHGNVHAVVTLALRPMLEPFDEPTPCSRLTTPSEHTCRHTWLRH
jgi:hypothetical protein